MVENVPWSAEEFEGEMVDRVRRTAGVEPEVAELGEAPARGRGHADRVRLYESDSDSAEPEGPDSVVNELYGGESDSADTGSPDSHSVDPGDVDHPDAETAESEPAASERHARRPTASPVAGRQSSSDRG
jgi:hypothetical protein